MRSFRGCHLSKLLKLSEKFGKIQLVNYLRGTQKLMEDFLESALKDELTMTSEKASEKQWSPYPYAYPYGRFEVDKLLPFVISLSLKIIIAGKLK